MPVQAEDGGADWLLDVLAHPPVIFLLKVTDGDEARAAAHGELVLPRRPLHAAGSAVDPEDDQGGLPSALLQGPHVGVTVRSAGDDAIAVRSPVDTCHLPIVLFQLMDLAPLGPILLVDVDLMVVGAQGDLGMILVPGVAANWFQQETMVGHGQ